MIDIDTIGSIFTPGTYDAEGNALTPAVQIPGYYVNTTAPVGGWEAFKLTSNPANRVFGGIITHSYKFEDVAEYEAYLATADLTAPTLPPTDTPVIAGVPQSISKRQAERVLYAEGKLDEVESILAAAPMEVQIDWRSAKDLDRTWPALLQMQSVLGWSDAYVDSLFIKGYQI